MLSVKISKLISILFIALFLIQCESKRAFEPVQNINSFEKTDFVLTLESKIDQKKNQIYCPTMLFAWNEIKTEIGQPEAIETQFEDLKILNDSKSYLNSLSEDEIENKVSIDGQFIQARSFFSKSLPFEFDFNRNNHDLKFKSVSVESFGFDFCPYQICSQLKVLFYESPKEFAVKLRPKNHDHEILLYKPANRKSKTLGDLYDGLNEKIKNHSKIAESGKNSWRYWVKEEDILSIPVLNFHLEKYYKNLIGNQIETTARTYEITEAHQRIAFILDEKGAEVESEATAAAAEAAEAPEEKPKPKKLIFDDSFFMVLKRKDSSNPYLVMWIDNNELMTEK